MKPINDKDTQVVYLKKRLNIFMEVLDSIDPEETEVEDIDRLIGMINDIELKCEQFRIRG
ncbi:SE1561 family protein [Domibacillus mangrovi]|uniref:Uncharacterized protein n=1 Tax=Domibacillus mangrovi TaxID=1714354 RepID=A0A1Q5P1C5_9BACI|nr:SE1561 family protein [Domibacillus mangrovi]OKL35978.1 hypothetical protein BLL40_11635 [Domibacillus mangrovi]